MTGDTWAQRFQRGRDAWAVAAGITVGATGLYVDQAHLIDELGLPWAGTPTRAIAAAEAKSPDP